MSTITITMDRNHTVVVSFLKDNLTTDGSPEIPETIPETISDMMNTMMKIMIPIMGMMMMMQMMTSLISSIGGVV
jgi:hypothetical protein